MLGQTRCTPLQQEGKAELPTPYKCLARPTPPCPTVAQASITCEPDGSALTNMQLPFLESSADLGDHPSGGAATHASARWPILGDFSLVRHPAFVPSTCHLRRQPRP